MASEPWTLREIETAKRLYNAGSSAEDAASEIGRNKDALIRVLRANGVKIRTRGRPSVEAERKCSSYEKMKEDAAFGSMQLLLAIQRAGLRPC